MKKKEKEIVNLINKKKLMKELEELKEFFGRKKYTVAEGVILLDLMRDTFLTQLDNSQDLNQLKRMFGGKK